MRKRKGTIAVQRIWEQKRDQLSGWFTEYVRSFCNDDPMQQRIFLLKEEHTLRVCKEIRAIGLNIGWSADELGLAEIIALFHDIGRFEQYARYKTFVDIRSENHAELGLTILDREGLLAGFDEELQRIIVESIRHHNRAALPCDGGEEGWLLYAKLLRDADKLDIWRVVTDYYNRSNDERNGAIELDLPDTPGFSAEVAEELSRQSIVHTKHLKNLNDFKLLQMGWVFDINFGMGHIKIPR